MGNGAGTRATLARMTARRYSGASARFTGKGYERLDAQMQHWVGREGVSDDGKFYRVYHGTRAGNVGGIREHGLKTPPGVNPTRWYMVTTQRDDAEGFGRNGNKINHDGQGRVIEYRIPMDEVSHYLGVGQHGANHYGAATGTYHGLLAPLPSKFIAEIQTPS